MDVPDTVVGSAGDSFFVGAYITHAAGQFPASIDESSQQGRSWVAGDDPGLGDINNLANNGLPPVNIDVVLPPGGNWLIRADAGPVGAPAPEPDGWYISFHEPLAIGGSALPPLGLYFCDPSIVDIFETEFNSCDVRTVYEYNADLADCCLIHANPDSRDSLTPAQPAQFNEIECFDYGFSVQATIGHRWEDPGGGCVEVDTGNSADDDFWGWESTSNENGILFGLQQALESIVSMSGPDWLYGPWNPVAPTCSAPNMAFALFTTTNPGTINDANETGVPDVCEPCDPPTVGDNTCWSGTTNVGTPCSTSADCGAGEVCGMTSRYLPITPVLCYGQASTIQVMTPGGDTWWAGAQETIDNGDAPDLSGAKLECTTTPTPSNWSAGVQYLYGAAIGPAASYEVRMCDATGVICSTPLIVDTGPWGEVIAPYVSTPSPNFGDITAIKDKFQGATAATHDMPRTDIAGPGADGTDNTPDEKADFIDVPKALAAFQGGSYPFTLPSCP